MYGPPSDPCANNVMLIVCDTPGCSSVCENKIAGIGLSVDVVPAEASINVADPPSTDTLAMPQRGFMVACQYIAVPIAMVSN